MTFEINRRNFLRGAAGSLILPQSRNLAAALAQAAAILR